MKKILPILSGSLRAIIKSCHDQYPKDPIVNEILRIDKIVELYLNNKEVLGEVEDYIIDVLNNLITGEVTMLSGRFGDEMVVSFLPGDREPEYTPTGDWSRRNRQTGKPGRIFQKLLKKEFKQIEWETFVNIFKSCMCCSQNFELVEGEQIPHWYNCYNYFREDGTLGNSCMRYSECGSYFKVYEDHARMLISTKDGKLTGRALVWTVDGITLLDRVYTCYDYLFNCFIDYAKEHGWWIRENNSLLDNGCNQGWLTPDDNYQNATYREFTIKVGTDYDQWPYMDSFRYYKKGYISTNYSDHSTYLSNTDGSAYHEYSWCCDRCGDTFYSSYSDECPDELVYSEYDSEYLCEDCRWYCECEDDYISNAHEAVTYHEDEDTEWLLPDDHHLLDNCYVIDGEYYDKSEFEVRRNEITGDLELVK